MKTIRMNDKQFAAAAAYYNTDAANTLANDFYQFAIESCLRYVEHGEVSHINTLATAAKRMRCVIVVRKMIAVVACHNMTTTGRYTGKAHTKRLNNLRKDVNKVTTKLETITKDAALAKVVKKEAKPFDTKAQTKTVATTVNKLIKADLSDDAIIALVRMQLEAARADAVTDVQSAVANG